MDRPSLWLKRNTHTLFTGSITVLILIVVDGFIFTFPIPRQIGLTFRYDLALIVPLVSLGYLILQRLPKPYRVGAGVLLALVVFAMPLSGLWASGASEPFTVGGLLPYSDARIYFQDALRLMDGGTFSTFSGRRPLYPAFLAGLLGLTGQNLQAALALTTVVMALASFCLAEEIRRTHGSLAAALVLTGLFLFCRRFIGTTMTENLGLPLGALGLALLWHAASQCSRWSAAAGLFVLGLALNARAGTFFILPVLIGWGVVLFAGRRRVSWSFAGLGTAAVIASFLLNFLVLRSLADPSSASFANFSDTLYGLSAGGKGWQQIAVDAPQVARLAEPGRSQQIYTLAFQNIRQHPELTFQGVAHAYRDFFTLDRTGVFGFVDSELANETRPTVVAVVILLYLLSAAGLVWSAKQWRDPIISLVLVGILGVILSIPFVPPDDANRMRAYAATLPFLLVLPALGLHAIAAVLPWKADGMVDGSSASLSGWALPGFVSFLVLFTVASPILIRAASASPVVTPPTCPVGEKSLLLRLNPGSSVMVTDDTASGADWLPEVRSYLFRKGSRTLSSGFSDELTALQPPFSLTDPNDISSGRNYWIVADPGRLPPAPTIIAACVTIFDTPELRARGFYRLQSAQQISHP